MLNIIQKALILTFGVPVFTLLFVISYEFIKFVILYLISKINDRRK